MCCGDKLHKGSYELMCHSMRAATRAIIRCSPTDCRVDDWVPRCGLFTRVGSFFMCAACSVVSVDGLGAWHRANESSVGDMVKPCVASLLRLPYPFLRGCAY